MKTQTSSQHTRCSNDAINKEPIHPSLKVSTWRGEGKEHIYIREEPLLPHTSTDN